MSEVAEADWKLIADFVRERFGLSFEGARRDILEARLRSRLCDLHLQTFREYYHYLSFHPAREAETSELSRRITNNETYFFREPHHFAFILNQVIPPLQSVLRTRPLRVLSAGCSSGEEPYSLVVNLVDSGLELQGYDVGPPLPPQVPLSDAGRSEIKDILADLDLVAASSERI